MLFNNQRLFRVGKRVAKLSLVILVLLSIFLAIAWRVLRSDHAYVIKRLQATALEKWQADLQLQGYSLEWIKPFPLIRFELRQLSFGTADNSQQPILKVNHAVSEFNPWNLLTGNLRAHPLELDSVWVYAFKDSLQQSNYRFSNDNVPQKKSKLNLDLADLPTTDIHFLDLHLQDDYSHKWQWAKLTDTHIKPQRDEQGKWTANLRTDCFFEGLVFKEADGGFLLNKAGTLDLNFYITDRGRKLQWKRSALQVAQNTYFLGGQFQLADTNQLQLQISTDAVTMAEVLPLLSDRVNTALCQLQIDQPIKADFFYSKDLVPGKRGAVELEFSSNAARVQYKDVHMTAVTLKGHFSNDCDHDGIGDPTTSCINLQQLDGDISGVLPAKMQGEITNLENPELNILGSLDIDFPRLNTLLAPEDKVTFTEGCAVVNFKYDGHLMNALASPFDEQNIRILGEAAFENVTLEANNFNTDLPSLSGRLSFDEMETRMENLSLDWNNSNIQLGGTLSNLPEFLFYPDQALKSELVLHFDVLDLTNFLSSNSTKTATDQISETDFKTLEKLARRLAVNLNGSMGIGIDKLIYDSLFFTDLKTQIHLFSPRQAEFIDSSMIRIDQFTAQFMGVTPFFLDLRLSRDAVTELLFDVDLPSAVQPANFFFPPEIKITEGTASMKLSGHLPLRSLLRPNGFLSDLRYQGRVNFDQIEIELSPFKWPVRKISGPVVFDSDQLHLDGLQFQYQGSPFFVDGHVDDYAIFRKNKDKKAVVDLQIRGRHLDFRSLHDQSKLAQKTDAFSTPEWFRSLDTVFHFATGKINLRLDSVLTNEETLRPVFLQMQLISGDLNPDEHQLVVDSFNFGFGEKDIVKGTARLINPNHPEIEADLKARMSLAHLGKWLPSEYVEMQDGYFKMDFQYTSPLYDTLDMQKYLLNANINGEAEVVNGKLFYNYRDFTFDNVYSHLSFDQRALYIRDLDMEINGNRFIASGESSDFFPFFLLPDRRAHIELNVTSPHFDFGKFTAPHGLGKDTISHPVFASQNTTVDESAAIANSTLSKTVGYIDQLLDKGSVDMTTTCEELVYHEFSAHKIIGNISLEPDTVQLNNLHMEVANGTFTVNGLISNVVLHQPRVEVDVQLMQNDVREIFRQFDDFGQTQFGYTNVEGLASANIQFKANINSNYSILPETMNGDMSVKLTGGQLIELNAMKKLTGFFFRNRKLNHILIDTLEMFTHIRGSDFYVDKFYLHSSSFDFGAQGIYSLGPDNKTLILFAVPIRNLFERHITREVMESGNSERKGARILIEARYKKGRLRFRWKPFVLRKKKYQLIEAVGE